MSPSYEKLKDHLRPLKSALVAFSGGVDSSLLLCAALDTFGGRVLAVTANSPLFPARELEAARRIAAQLGARHRVIETNELADPAFRANTPERCYHCKKHLFGRLMQMATEEGLAVVLDGANFDDQDDYRPGMRAAAELGVRSPYVEMGFGKELIRNLARLRGLEVWNEPSAACLASRIPYGDEISAERLERIEQAEDLLRRADFRQVRARDHGNLVRIEVGPAELTRGLDPDIRAELLAGLKKIGYIYVTLDLEGFRSGAMNEAL
ncbi:MAG TPA: ATP-dependent sacrificial sulfur transferase LarE [Myxococcota bacterium]|nr:ATP-dependent sacrificial sulfur transferase LarE [Myxococcota bacterium]